LLFFFQAEDGIRDPLVTGVQTCALPIFEICGVIATTSSIDRYSGLSTCNCSGRPRAKLLACLKTAMYEVRPTALKNSKETPDERSEERRVGKASRHRGDEEP